MKMNLLVTFTENWIEYAKVMLYSLTKNTPNAVFDVYLLCETFSSSGLSDFSKFLCEKCRATLHPFIISAEQVQGLKLGRWPAITYYRVLAPWVLPETVERVLYLDVDILVLRSIEALYNCDLQNNLLTGFKECATSERTKDLGLQHDCYINAGILLMDLVKIRTKFSWADMMKCYADICNYIEFPDQDLLNAAYDGMIQEQPLDYTVLFLTEHMRYTKAFCQYIESNSCFLHFITEHKIWDANCSRTYFRRLYQQYAAEIGVMLPRQNKWYLMKRRMVHLVKKY